MITQAHATRLNELSIELQEIEKQRARLAQENIKLCKEVCSLFQFDEEGSDFSHDLLMGVVSGEGPTFELPEEEEPVATPDFRFLKKLSKADERTLAELVRWYNYRVENFPPSQLPVAMRNMFNNKVGKWLRDSSGDIVRAKRNAAVLSTFPGMTAATVDLAFKQRLPKMFMGVTGTDWPLI